MSLVGRQIGRYRILEQLGSGGMSVVYKGLDTALDRQVAVKVLHPHLSQKPESRKRLAREAKAVAKLHHPNIVEVFDFSEGDSEDAFLVTELIPGQTLRAYVETERLEPPELAAMVVHQIAAALAHAHEEGVIHRDLKPENVMVRKDGVLKLMDFGIAKIVDRDDRMTQTGALVGSPAHMAPEVIEGEEVGPEADVFSLGTMLYAFAVGTLPFHGPTTTATLKRILDGEYVDPRQRSQSVSDGLAAIIARCLARDPKARFSSAVALRDALGEELSSLGIDRVDEELADFFADPEGYRPRLVARLVERLLARAEDAIREKRPALAIASLNPLLALDPGHPRGSELLAKLGRRRRKRRRLRQALVAALAVGAIACAAVGGQHLWAAHRARVQAAAAAKAPGTSLAKSPSQPTRPPQKAPSGSPSGALPATVTAAATQEGSPPRASPAPAPPAPERESARTPVSARHERPSRRVATAPRTAELKARVLVRPYGFIRVDGGPLSAQALAQHVLSLAPGRHKVQITCRFCEPTEETITVRAGQENVFRLPAEPKPSHVSFDYQPKDAQVTVEDAPPRSVAQSLAAPFEVRSAKGPASFQHSVTYEIRREGYATEHKTVLIPAGQTVVLHGKLAPR